MVRGKVSETFISAGQHPWIDCEEQFEAHLEELSKLPLYAGCQSSVQDLLLDRAFESKAEVVLETIQRGKSMLVEEDDVEDDVEDDG